MCHEYKLQLLHTLYYKHQIYSINMTFGSVMFCTLYYKCQIYSIVTNQYYLSTTNVGLAHARQTNVKLHL